MKGVSTALQALPAVPGVGDFAAYLREIRKFPVLTEKQEKRLARDLRSKGDIKAAHALVCSHLRQVVAIARTYSGYGLDQQDLVQEGNFGLMTAVKKFDPDKGVRLNAYAAYWIRSFINEFVLRNWRIVKVATSRSQRKLFYNLRRMTQQLGRKLTAKQADRIADELDVPKSDVIEMNARMQSYDVPFDPADATDDEYDRSPAATMVADNGRHAEVILADRSRADTRKAALQSALDELEERERLIIEARALSPSGKDVKLSELAAKFGISSERVRQLEAKAMAKMRASVLRDCPA